MRLMQRSFRPGALCLLALLGTAHFSQRAFSADPPLEEGCCVVNVNTATLEELITVPGLGAKLSKAVIDNRPYERVDDLLRVDGIGEKSLKAMRPYLRVKGRTEPFE